MSRLEETLFWQIRLAGLPLPEREFRALPDRWFRWDLAWPDRRLLLEVQGGVWKKGGHSSGAGINRDTEKGNLATLAGWRQLHVTVNQIRSGQALEWVTRALRN